MLLPVLFLAVVQAIAQPAPGTQQSGIWLNKGVQAFKNARYQEAVAAFRQAVDLNPQAVTPRLYLATSWMQQYIPGADSPENLECARNAELEFQRVLQLDPNHVVALSSLASLQFYQAGGSRNPEEKSRRFEEAAWWYRKVTAANPNNKEAHYTIGVIDWSKCYPILAAAREKLGLRVEDPGPLPPGPVRQQFRDQCSSTIEDGISELQRAIELDPEYDDAMAYMNLLLRERADMRETAEEYRRDVESADQWVHKTLELKRKKQGATQDSSRMAADTPSDPSSSRPSRIRVGGNAQESKLVERVSPVYPQVARESRIQGTVRFSVVIDGAGRIKTVELVSGHPLLVPPALEAVKQWVYKPTLLNGEPVEVITQIDVNFVLDEGRCN